MAEELGEQSLILAEGDDTVADVAGRKHVEFFAQTAAGTAVVTDGNHGAKIPDDGRTGLSHGHFCRGESEAFESFEQSGEAGPAADGDYAEATLARGLLHQQQICDSGFHENLVCLSRATRLP